MLTITGLNHESYLEAVMSVEYIVANQSLKLNLFDLKDIYSIDNAKSIEITKIIINDTIPIENINIKLSVQNNIGYISLESLQNKTNQIINGAFVFYGTITYQGKLSIFDETTSGMGCSIKLYAKVSNEDKNTKILSLVSIFVKPE